MIKVSFDKDSGATFATAHASIISYQLFPHLGRGLALFGIWTTKANKDAGKPYEDTVQVSFEDDAETGDNWFTDHLTLAKLTGSDPEKQLYTAAMLKDPLLKTGTAVLPTRRPPCRCRACLGTA